MSGRRVVETIPAKNQKCRTNYITSVQQEKINNIRERVEEEKKGALQYSYNSWGEQEGGRSRLKNGVERSSDSLSMTQVWKTINHK